MRYKIASGIRQDWQQLDPLLQEAVLDIIEDKPDRPNAVESDGSLTSRLRIERAAHEDIVTIAANWIEAEELAELVGLHYERQSTRL